MINREKNQIIYRLAYNYLIDILPKQLNPNDLEKYFNGDKKDFNSLSDIFEQLIQSAQNYQRMPNVIKFAERKDRIKAILYEYDCSEIAGYNVEGLYQRFRKEFKVNSTDSNQNSWYKWSKSIIDAARFICEFRNVNDFIIFVDQFNHNVLTRMALPLLISQKVSGIGFTLACDYLKELGFVNYPKPDVHLIEVFSRLGLADQNPISTFEAIIRMSDICKEFDGTATPYKIDKIIWLICSGRFYKDKIICSRHKEDFIIMATQYIQ